MSRLFETLWGGDRQQFLYPYPSGGVEMGGVPGTRYFPGATGHFREAGSWRVLVASRDSRNAQKIGSYARFSDAQEMRFPISESTKKAPVCNFRLRDGATENAQLRGVLVKSSA